MSREIPEAVRAAAGLAATVLDEVRQLPRTLPALPVRALGLLMQTTLRLQQEYSGLVARGDEVFTGLRGDAEPGMATFDDDDLPDAPVRGGRPARAPGTGGLGSQDSAFDRVLSDPVDSFDDDLPDEVETDLTAVDLGSVGIPDSLDDDLPGEVTTELGATGNGTNDRDAASTGTRGTAPSDTDPSDSAPTDTDPTDTDPTDTDPTATGPTVRGTAESDLTAPPAAPPLIIVDRAAAIGEDDLLDETLAEEEMRAEELTADLGDADLTDDEVAGLPADPEADEVTATVDQLAVAMGVDAAEDDAVIAASERAIGATGWPADDVVGTRGTDGTAGTDGTDHDAPTDAPTTMADEWQRTAPTGIPESNAVPPHESSTDAPTTMADEWQPSTSDTPATLADGPRESPAGAPATDAAPAQESTDGPSTSDAPAGGSDLSGSAAAGAAPIEGYDGLTMPQLRGRLRVYGRDTVAELLTYEQATRDRTSFVVLLRNRQEKLDREGS